MRLGRALGPAPAPLVWPARPLLLCVDLCVVLWCVPVVCVRGLVVALRMGCGDGVRGGSLHVGVGPAAHARVGTV